MLGSLLLHTGYLWLQGESGLLFVAVLGLLIAVASLVAEQSSRRAGLSSFGSWALEHRLGS